MCNFRMVRTVVVDGEESNTARGQCAINNTSRVQQYTHSVPCLRQVCVRIPDDVLLTSDAARPLPVTCPTPSPISDDRLRRRRPQKGDSAFRLPSRAPPFPPPALPTLGAPLSTPWASSTSTYTTTITAKARGKGRLLRLPCRPAWVPPLRPLGGR